MEHEETQHQNIYPSQAIINNVEQGECAPEAWTTKTQISIHQHHYLALVKLHQWHHPTPTNLHQTHRKNPISLQ
jgi:hypothetical protein